MKKHLLFFFLLLIFTGFSQNSKLEIILNIKDYTADLDISVRKGNSTIYFEKHSSYNSFESIIIDSLIAEEYIIEAFDNNSTSGVPYFTKTVTLEAYSTTKINLDISFYEEIFDLDTTTREEISNEKMEMQINGSYMRNGWLNPTSIFQTSYSFGFTQFVWHPINKHIGLLAGSGLSISQYYFNKDTSNYPTIPYKKYYENYTYLALNMDLKFRLSTGNQQKTDYYTSKFLIDIGALYNLPVVFKNIARYEGGNKMTTSFIHQFTDARAYINIGYVPVLFFVEYRLFNFIMGNYTEIEKIRVGIKINPG